MLSSIAFVLLNHMLNFLNHLILSEAHYSFNNLWQVNSPNVVTLFSCFTGSPWGWGDMIFDPYSVPTEVKNKLKVLADVAGTFSPDNYEVFYLV